MNGFNQVILMGFVGNDPTVSSEEKKPFATFSIAITKCYESHGEERTVTYWHKVVVYGRLATAMKHHLKKGDKILLRGELENVAWQDKAGEQHLTTQIMGTDIRFLSQKKPQRATSVPNHDINVPKTNTTQVRGLKTSNVTPIR